MKSRTKLHKLTDSKWIFADFKHENKTFRAD